MHIEREWALSSFHPVSSSEGVALHLSIDILEKKRELFVGYVLDQDQTFKFLLYNIFF